VSPGKKEVGGRQRRTKETSKGTTKEGYMADEDIALMAHVLRRAGFGTSLQEIEACAAKGYDTVVEELLTTCPR